MRLRYTLMMDEPNTHYLRVIIRASGFAGLLREPGVMHLVMPVWTPGSYLVREFSRNVLDVAVKDGAGRSLSVEKESKNRWRVSLRGEEEVEIDYKVYAYAYTSNCSYVDSRHAVVNGASVFLYVEGMEAEPLRLEVIPHVEWSVVTTGLTQLSGVRALEFQAQSYDELVDSPIEIGNQGVESFEVGGVRHEVSIFSPVSIGREREAGLVSDIRRIVESTIPIFGEIPYRRYVFLVDFAESAPGGTEHLNSTLCLISYLSLDPPEEYRNMLTLFSHEFFHTWNVKRMRPVGLGPFNYAAETYTRSLWIAEGITSYYDDLIVRRAGIYSVPEYLDALSAQISIVRSLPSNRWRSPEESSFNTWINFYRPNENTPNVSPSYYNQGAVVGCVLDLQIRKGSLGAVSLDDVMRSVYNETYKQGRAYTDEEFERACDVASRGTVSEIFEGHVRGREPIDFERYLGYAGLALLPRGSAAAIQKEGFLGVKVSGVGDRVTVLSALSGSPAEDCDLSAGDEIIGIDGLRVDGQKLAFWLATRRPGTKHRILTAREGVLREVTATLAPKPIMDFRVQKKETALPEEKALFESWLLQGWDEPIQYGDYRTSPARRKLLDYI